MASTTDVKAATLATLENYEDMFIAAFTDKPFESDTAYMKRIVAYAESLLADIATPPLYKARAHGILASGYSWIDGHCGQSYSAAAKRHMKAAVVEFNKARKVAVDDPIYFLLFKNTEKQIEMCTKFVQLKKEKKRERKTAEEVHKESEGTEEGATTKS